MRRYTQWLNTCGKLEADLTVTKLAEDRFLVVATDTMHRHVETWMKRHAHPDDSFYVVDVTGALAQVRTADPSHPTPTPTHRPLYAAKMWRTLSSRAQPGHGLPLHV